ncbi:MAG: NAD-binding protein [Deltaproteobacteria bacterium]|nr:NAD-binding protein [Deltaproteobacteria bacterium]
MHGPAFLQGIRKVIRLLRKEHFFLIAAVTASVILLCALAVWYVEHERPDSLITTYWDGIWWAVVTICTVGYGDKLPISDEGKIIGIILMISGIFLLSLITATIVSVFVEQKIKEGRGLKAVRSKDHIVVCGWNQYAEELLLWLYRFGDEKDPPVVLVNELSIDETDMLKLKYERYGLEIIRGNYIHEDALLKADIRRARFAVIMADTSGEAADRNRTDERTILTALTIKSLAPKIKIVAELLNSENKSHLRRAQVDDIIVRGEHVGSLLASAVNYPGLPRVFSSILSPDDRNKLIRADIPAGFVGKTVRELAEHFRKHRSGILIGLLKEKESVKLEDMLSDDSSVIDRFIKEKIRESKKDLFYDKEQIKVIINPDEGDIISRNDYAILLSKEAGP